MLNSGKPGLKIYIDESGSFVRTEKPASWNAIAALVVTESARAALCKAIGELKRSSGKLGAKEVKLPGVPEDVYFRFIARLIDADCLLFTIATDAGLNTIESVSRHQAGQVAKIREHLHKMIYPSGREGVELLAKQVEGLSRQLYVQLFCQVQLMYDVLAGAVNYFAQRHPVTLRAFRWRVDQKDAQRKAVFEEAFEKLSPALIQSISIRRPMIMIDEFDYSGMDGYLYSHAEKPTYLRDVYGLDVDGGDWNLSRIMREDMAFVDSKDHDGVQAVDLLASGIRRCLRMGFEDNARAADLLGSLMLHPMDERADNDHRPMRLVSFGENSIVAEGADKLVARMRRRAKPPLLS